jgi:hypothetical protein
MDAWAELRTVLARLRAEQPEALLGSPDLSAEVTLPPPFTIMLAPWATATAHDLHERFGDRVDLTVGALPYPPGRTPAQPRAVSAPRPPVELLDPAEVRVELGGPAEVRSGHTLRHGLLLRNLTATELAVATNGQVTAVVVDPASGEVVGGFSGAQTLPLIMFRVAPGETERIPLLIGTASFRPALGYAVPAGAWGIQADLTLGDPVLGGGPEGSVRRRTPILPLTVVA